MGLVTGAGAGVVFGGDLTPTPDQISSTCLAWWTAQRPASVTLNGSAVAAVADQTKNGYNLAQATGAAQPLWQFNAATNKNEIYQDTSSAKSLGCTVAGLLAALSGTNKNYTFAWRGRGTVTDPVNVTLVQMLGAAGITAQIAYTNANGIKGARYDGSLNKSTAYTAIGDTSYHTWAVAFDGTSMSIYKDGALVAGPTNGVMGAQTFTSLYLGFAQTAMLGAAVHSSALSSSQIIQLHGSMSTYC